MDDRPVVFRVQDDDGRGPWRPGFSHHWIDDDAPVGRLAETVMHLLPIQALQMLPRDRNYGCACRSKAALLEWFTPVERERLQRFGYRIVRLRVDEVLAESRYQVFFARYRPLASGAVVLRWD
jgi:hypothetical protein